MKPQDFVLKSLLKLTTKFQNEILEYHFSNITDTHIIKVINNDLCESDTFIDAQVEILDKFIELNPVHNLMFVSDADDLGYIQDPYKIIANGICIDGDCDTDTFASFMEQIVIPQNIDIIEGGIDNDENYIPYSHFVECGEINYALAA